MTNVITITTPIGGYVGDIVVDGQWFRPQTEREEAMAAEIRRLAGRTAPLPSEVPIDEVWFVNRDGSIAAKIVNIGPSE